MHVHALLFVNTNSNIFILYKNLFVFCSFVKFQNKIQF